MNAYKPLLELLTPDQKRLAKEQLSVLKGLPHPHLCRIDQVTDSNGPLSVVGEYLGDTLNTCLRKQERTWACEELALQFLGLVAALGKTQAMVGTTQGFAHGRLSLEALHLDYEGNKIKIVGFGGFSGNPEDSTQACSQLPPQYHSPEIRRGVHFNAYKADMWALGICFLQLATSTFCTGQEAIDQLAHQAASLGPQLGDLLQLVLTGERNRPDFLQFKELSGYCQRCWGNIDIGESLCGTCPNRGKGANPLQIRQAESDQIGRPQRVYRQIVPESSPGPQCMLCKRPLTKANEKDTCLLCLLDPNRRPVPQQPIQPKPQSEAQQISQPAKQFPLPDGKQNQSQADKKFSLSVGKQFPLQGDKGQKIAAQPLPQNSENPKQSLVPQKPNALVEGKNPNPSPFRPAEPFKPERYPPPPDRRISTGGREQSNCLSCKNPLPEVPRSRPGYEGYSELCEKCAAAQLAIEWQ